jgi:hypothetical protein
LHADIIRKTGFKYIDYLKNPAATCRKVKRLKIALTFLSLQDQTIPKDELLNLLSEVENFTC